MGAEIITARAHRGAEPKGQPRARTSCLRKITVTGTQNILIARRWRARQFSMQREPEVTDLVVMLRKMGTQISGDGS
jgi:UDP-N-acetylglucosamine enolpyruvyl transferase